MATPRENQFRVDRLLDRDFLGTSFLKGPILARANREGNRYLVSVDRDAGQRLLEHGGQLADDRVEREHFVELPRKRRARRDGDVPEMAALLDGLGGPVIHERLRAGAIGVAREDAGETLGEHKPL